MKTNTHALTSNGNKYAVMCRTTKQRKIKICTGRNFVILTTMAIHFTATPCDQHVAM